MIAMVSREFASGKQLLWSNIAAGKYDTSVLDPEAARLKAYGKPIFLTFDPEMDGRFRLGIAGNTSQYVAAFRHIHDRMVADGAKNVIWVWTVTGYQAHDADFKLLYPGNAYVDWIGWDPYNFAACHKEGWKTFNQTIDPFYQWLESNGYGSKPFILPEYGTVIDSSNSAAAATWFKGIPASLASHPNLKAVSEFDDTAGGCNTELQLGPGEMTAFGAATKAVGSPSTP
jgi:beta-mannanase